MTTKVELTLTALVKELPDGIAFVCRVSKALPPFPPNEREREREKEREKQT